MTAVFFAVSCKRSKHPAAWLIGTWVNHTGHGTVYEEWVQVNDSVLSGKSYTTDEGDTSVLETLLLLREKKHLVYIPVVAGQNDGKPVRFKSEIITDTLLTFENPAHDFPQKISYKKFGNDSLEAAISGMQEGREKRIVFAMRRCRQM